MVWKEHHVSTIRLSQDITQIRLNYCKVICIINILHLWDLKIAEKSLKIKKKLKKYPH